MKIKKNTRDAIISYSLATVAFLICQSMISSGAMSRALRGQRTPGRVATLYLVRISRHTGGKDSTHPPAQ